MTIPARQAFGDPHLGDFSGPRPARGPAVFVVALALALTACSTTASAGAAECRAGLTPMTVAELLFGRNIDDRHGVTEKQWRRFLADEVTPRFPDGITVVDAAGQWRDRETDQVVRERTKLVTLIVVDDLETQAKIDAVVTAYKTRFRQQAVGVVLRPACVSFGN